MVEEEEQEVEEEMDSQDIPDGADKSQRGQLVLVYLIFFAEAYVFSDWRSIVTDYQPSLD